MIMVFYFFFFKQKTAYEMRISDWSSDVCSSDLLGPSVDDRRDDVMVHDAGLARDILCAGDAFVLGLVREHRAGNDVADRPDAVDRGAEIMVGLDLAALVELQSPIGRASWRVSVCQSV